MTDPDRRTCGHDLRLAIADLPFGEATWQFTTPADENGVTVAELVAVPGADKSGEAGR